jgi:cob(I)alamin adenosyltransferase
MKIYTGTGDKGTTSLFSGERVSKSHDRLQAYGDLDELSSFLGILAAKISPLEIETITQIRAIQSDLLSMGAWLATTPDSRSACVLQEMTEGPRRQLEQKIDFMQEQLTSLSNFILPGGCETAAFAHVARTVCRRAERDVVSMYASMGEAERTPQIEMFLIYLNRLSDYLFVLARFCNAMHGVCDITWSHS